MNQKNYKPKTKTKINSRTMVILIITIVIVAASLITASLLTPGSIGNFYSGSSDINLNTNIILPTQGWCVTGRGLSGDNGKHTTKDSCIKRASDDDPDTNWYAFCPDIAGQGDRTESSCGCNATDITKSEALNDIIAMRDGLIDALNDGHISPTDTKNMSKFDIATSLDCACHIWVSDEAPADSNKILTSSHSPLKVKNDERRVEDGKFQGTFALISKANKLFSKMNLPSTRLNSNNQKEKYCTIFPEGMDSESCQITSSYDSTRNQIDSPIFNPKSAHLLGLAIDISCSETNSIDPNKCTGNTSKILSRIKNANPGFNIIEECNQVQSACNGGSSNQVIHLDLKSRLKENCYIIDCSYNCQ